MIINNKGRIAFVLFIFILGQDLMAQEKTNQFDANGKRTGSWIKYHNNNRIRYQGQFEAGKEVGVFKYYSISSSEFPIIVKTFSKDGNSAAVIFYTEGGVIESEGKMIGKLRIGEWKYYYGDGKTLMIEENYENGILNGASKSYYKSGKITEELFYKNGKLDGNIKRYADNGVLIDDLNYEMGILNGLAKYFDLEGNLIYTGFYKNDVKVGKWEYYENGKKVKKPASKQ